MTENFPETHATSDEHPDGTAQPTAQEMPDEEGSADLSDAVLPDEVWEGSADPEESN